MKTKYNYFYKIFKDGMLQDIIIFLVPVELEQDDFEDWLKHYKNIGDNDLEYICDRLTEHGVQVFSGLAQYN